MYALQTAVLTPPSLKIRTAELDSLRELAPLSTTTPFPVRVGWRAGGMLYSGQQRGRGGDGGDWKGEGREGYVLG